MDDPEQIRLSCNHDLEAERSVVRKSLEDILSEIERATRNEGLAIPLS